MIITISASYGAGGSELGPRIAQRLGLRFIDRAVPVAVADELGISVQDAEAIEQDTPSRFWHFFAHMSSLSPGMVVPAPVEQGVTRPRCDARDGSRIAQGGGQWEWRHPRACRSRGAREPLGRSACPARRTAAGSGQDGNAAARHRRGRCGGSSAQERQNPGGVRETLLRRRFREREALSPGARYGSHRLGYRGAADPWRSEEQLNDER